MAEAACSSEVERTPISDAEVRGKIDRSRGHPWRLGGIQRQNAFVKQGLTTGDCQPGIGGIALPVRATVQLEAMPEITCSTGLGLGNGTGGSSKSSLRLYASRCASARSAVAAHCVLGVSRRADTRVQWVSELFLETAKSKEFAAVDILQPLQE